MSRQLKLFDNTKYQVIFSHGDYVQSPSLYPETFQLLQENENIWWALSEHGYLSRCYPEVLVKLGFSKSDSFK